MRDSDDTMQPTVTIRKATADDSPALVPLVAAYWRFENIGGFDETRTRASLHSLLADSRLGEGWIADVDEKPVGYLLAVYVFSLEHGGMTAEIDEFFVLPEARRTGIGSRLLTIAEDAFRAAGCGNVSLQLGRGNERGRAFYFRHGYTPRNDFELLEKQLASD